MGYSPRGHKESDTTKRLSTGLKKCVHSTFSHLASVKSWDEGQGCMSCFICTVWFWLLTAQRWGSQPGAANLAPQVKGISFPFFRCQLQALGLAGPLHLWPPGPIFGSSHCPLRFNHLLKWLSTQEGAVLRINILLWRIQTRICQMERDVERDLRGSQTQCSHVLRTHPPTPSFCDYQGSLPASQNPEVLLGFYYIGTIDWIMDHKVEFHL